jgi:hypothetical protein
MLILYTHYNTWQCCCAAACIQLLLPHSHNCCLAVLAVLAPIRPLLPLNSDEYAAGTAKIPAGNSTAQRNTVNTRFLLQDTAKQTHNTAPNRQLPATLQVLSAAGYKTNGTCV